MRHLQIGVFILGTALLIVSAFAIGQEFGETFYNAGIALLMLCAYSSGQWRIARRVIQSCVICVIRGALTWLSA
jgi:hypothetical protein